jgi:hypothetical protein
MSQRRFLWGCAITTLVVATGVVLWWPAPPSPGVTVANCERIQLGMTLGEVKALLGRRCQYLGFSEGGPVCVERLGGEVGDIALPAEHYCWWGKDVVVMVHIGEHGQVVYARFHDSSGSERDSYQRIRAWLGW